eukprot:TRINITY_DN7547_c0_g1_i1.p1 TRINITY_DN7547_c0_g1~~TRINITY_DN7547_c0_g1_i1.p1  ORF type:complete len:784 (-),score=148.89 TRINITY_DN7547_c0_g1_i1:215-2566(-)
MASKRRLSVSLGKLFSKEKSKDEKAFVPEKEDKSKSEQSEKNDLEEMQMMLDDEKKEEGEFKKGDPEATLNTKTGRRNSAPDLVKVLKPYSRTLSQGTVAKLNIPSSTRQSTISEKKNKYSSFARTSIRNLTLFKVPSKETLGPDLGSNLFMKGIEFNSTRPGEILGGTLSKILKWLFINSSEQEFEAHIQPLLFGYRGFCTKDNLLEICLKIHDKNVQTQHNKHVKHRFVRTLKIWLKEWSFDFTTEMTLLDRTVSFVLQNQASILQDDAIELYLLTGILRRNHAKMISLKSSVDTETNTAGRNPPQLSESVNTRRLLDSKDYLSKCWKNSQSLLHYNFSEISKELTIRQLSLFEKVELKELVDKNWTRNNTDLAPNLLRVIERSNKVTYWVATMVLTAPSTQAQIAVVKHFIQIAKKLATLNNFESLTQVVNGLSHSSVSRLKSVFKTLPSTFNQTLTKLKEFTSPNMGYRLYRRRIAKIDCPYFPILAVVLHDYVMIDEVTPSYRKAGAGYINLEKIRTLYSDSTSLLSNVKLYAEFVNNSWLALPSLMEQVTSSRSANFDIKTVHKPSRSPQRGSMTFRLPPVAVVLNSTQTVGADQDRAPSPSRQNMTRRGISPSHFGPTHGSIIGRTLATSRLSRSPSERINEMFREKEESSDDGSLSNLSSSSVIPLFDVLDSLIALSEKDLYDKSLMIEPRSSVSRGTVTFSAPPVEKDENEDLSSTDRIGTVPIHPLLDLQNTSSPNLLTNLSNFSSSMIEDTSSVDGSVSVSVSNSPSFPMLC